MRVYEFAKKYNVSSKDLLKQLSAAGLAVKSHMSVLEEKALDLLKKKYGDTKKKEAKKVEPTKAPKKAPQKIIPETKKMQPRKQDQIKKLQKQDITPVETQEVSGLPLEPATPGHIANIIGVSANDVILLLLKWGILSNKNQVLPVEMVQKIAGHYDFPVAKPLSKEINIKKEIVKSGSLQERLPIVAVLGHVDHGKTTLLDHIRKTRVAEREKGGITQHLGAYEAKTGHGNIIFLDTPGHAAFSKIRERGAKVADIVVLVIAADDGIMPQTIEAIKHAKSVDTTIIVAINKIDKVGKPQIETVKRQLSQYDLLPEEWGGDVVIVGISAKEGTNVDQLLEMIILQSQLMELKADITGIARGYVLESKLEKGRGPVATYLGQHGILKLGDYFLVGKTYGKVTSMVDSFGKRVKQANPSIPVLVAGFDALPEAGDYFKVVPKQTYLKARSRHGYKQTSMPQQLIEKDAISILIKTDSYSSEEALVDSLKKLNKKLPRHINIIASGIGDINESDVMLASDTGAMLLGLHIKTEANAIILARRLKIDIKIYYIIYKLLESLEELSVRTKKVVMVLSKIGEAEVRKVFDIKGVGVIAGCYVKDGRFSKDGIAQIWRGKDKIGEGKILSLQRDRKPVKEVHTGFECGFLVDGHTDWQEGDRVECSILVVES